MCAVIWEGPDWEGGSEKLNGFHGEAEERGVLAVNSIKLETVKFGSI